MQLSKIVEYMNNHKSKQISCTLYRYDSEVKGTFAFMTPKGTTKNSKKWKSIEIDVDIKPYGNTILEWHESQNSNRFFKYLKYIKYYDMRENCNEYT